MTRIRRLAALCPSSPCFCAPSSTVSRACASIVSVNPVGRQAPDLLAVVALRDQPGFRLEHVVKAIVGVADRARMPRDPEFLRRHAFHARALMGARGPHGDVVEERMANSEWRIGMASSPLAISLFAIRRSVCATISTSRSLR